VVQLARPWPCLRRQPSASQAANEQRENYIWDAGVSPPLACNPNAKLFSLFRCRPLPAIECKLNRAAHEVNFTCISLAISACSTQRVMLHGEKMRLSSVHATKAKRNSFSKMVSISKKSN